MQLDALIEILQMVQAIYGADQEVTLFDWHGDPIQDLIVMNWSFDDRPVLALNDASNRDD